MRNWCGICVIIMCLRKVTTAVDSSLQSFPVVVTASGIEDVEKFATVINFYIEVESLDDEDYNITVKPERCCLKIDTNDIDCGGVMQLRPPVNLFIGLSHIGRAEFMFRNLYARYRKGNCTFSIYSRSGYIWKFKHTIKFNTYPNVYHDATVICPGIDQDPDRKCTPVDCAIKYNGKRNFYRDSTQKCEKVVECDTRGTDGVTTIAYYDWDNNLCLPLEDIFNDGAVIEEKNVVIPAELDPSQNTIFPDLEASRAQELLESGNYELRCNNGVQRGIICECNDGWMSSGIHESNLLGFHWCDIRKIDKASLQMEPKRLPKAVEELHLSVYELIFDNILKIC